MLPHTLVVGLGNPIVGDDGIGWRVAERILQQMQDSETKPDEVDIECLAVGGLRLMEFMVGYDYAIVIDMLFTGQQPAGHVSCFPLEDLPDLAARHVTSTHDTSLQSALKLGRELGLRLPQKIMVVGIEANNCYNFSEELTSPIEAAIPQAVQMVVQLLSNCSLN